MRTIALIISGTTMQQQVVVLLITPYFIQVLTHSYVIPKYLRTQVRCARLLVCIPYYPEAMQQQRGVYSLVVMILCGTHVLYFVYTEKYLPCLIRVSVVALVLLAARTCVRYAERLLRTSSLYSSSTSYEVNGSYKVKKQAHYFLCLKYNDTSSAPLCKWSFEGI